MANTKHSKRIRNNNTSPPHKSSLPSILMFRRQLYPYYLIAIAAFVLYLPTLQFGFVLDDEAVITKNQFVRNGIQNWKDILTNDSYAGYEAFQGDPGILSGGRYRPLSLLVFAGIVSLLGNDPMWFHLISVLAYVGVALLFFHWLRNLFHDKGWWSVSFLSAILFVVHPIHTEVVANVKSLDETLALLFSLGALYVLSGLKIKSAWMFTIAAGCAVLACLAKEHAVVLGILTPLCLWLMRKESIFKSILNSLPVWTGIGVCLILRAIILDGWHTGTSMHDPLNNPFLSWDGQTWQPFTLLQKTGVLLSAWFDYMRLLLIPYPLTHDYYPMMYSADIAFGWKMIAGSVMAGFILALTIVSLKKRKSIAFPVWMLVLPLIPVMNIFFPVGVFLAERFLFMPSAGFCLLIGMVWSQFFKNRSSNALKIIPGILILIFTVITFTRMHAWERNRSLLESAAGVSDRSVKWRYDMGTELLTEALQMPDTDERRSKIKTAVTHLQYATDHHPTYFNALLALGAASYYAGDTQASVDAYSAAVTISTDDQKAISGQYYAMVAHGEYVLASGDTLQALDWWDKALTIQPDTAFIRRVAEVKNHFSKK